MFSSSDKSANKPLNSKLGADMPAFKYFINKSTVLGVYREAMQMCKKGFSDKQMS